MISLLSGCMHIRGVEVTSLNLLSSPNATTSLGWVQSSPRGVLSATATWVVSSSSTLSNQKIQFYRDSTCSMPNGAIIDLVSSTINTRVLNGLNGITYSY